MKSRSVNLLFAVLCIAGVLLLELGMPAPGQSEEFWKGTVTANVNLRKAPSLKGAIVKGLLKGSLVKIYAEQDGWYRISAQKYHQVFKGWVSIEYVEIITEEPSVTAPVAEVPEPEQQGQLLSPPAESVQPAAAPPEPEPQAVVAPEPAPESQPVAAPEPEPEKQAVAKPPETKAATPKPARPPRVEKPPVADAAATPADDWVHLLPMALPVVAVIVLLVAVIVYRIKRASGKKAGELAAPDEWSTSLDGDEQALAENGPLEAGLSPSLEEELSEPVAEELSPALEEEPGEPFAEDLSPSLEEDINEPFAEDPSPSLEEELKDPFAEDLSPPLEEEINEPVERDLSLPSEEEPGETYEVDPSLLLEEDKSEPVKEEKGQPLEEVLADGIDFQMEFTPEDSGIVDESDSPVRDASVYNQVMEVVNRMSDVELTELLDLVSGQLGEKSRQDDRLAFYSMVDFVVAGQYYRDFIQDLSVSGVFIKGRHMFEPGQAILLTFMSPYFQKPFKISGEIVRILDTGIGVKFDTESQVQAEALSALIKQIRMLEEEV